jgi:hypothetical protein
MFYTVHEHSKFTSAIDKYWRFKTEKQAQKFFNEMVEEYNSDDELEIDGAYCDLGDGDYLEYYADKFENEKNDSEKSNSSDSESESDSGNSSESSSESEEEEDEESD